MGKRKDIKREVYKLIDDGFPVSDMTGKHHFGNDAKDEFEHGGGAAVLVFIIIVFFLIAYLALLPAMMTIR